MGRKLEKVHVPAWQTSGTCTFCGKPIYTLDDFQAACQKNKGKRRHNSVFMMESSRMWFQGAVVQRLFSSGPNLIVSNKPEISTLRSYGLNEVRIRVRCAKQYGSQLTTYTVNYMDLWTIHHHLPIFLEGKQMSLQNLWVRLTQLELFEHITKPNHRRKNAIFYHWRAGNEIRQDVCYVIEPLQV